MNRRRGFLTLWLLMAMAGLITVMSCVLWGTVHFLRAGTGAEDGLHAQYAAESGAVWGLEMVKDRGLENRMVELPLGMSESCMVRIRKNGESEGTIDTRGRSGTGMLRYVRLTVDVSGEEPRVVTVKEVENRKW